MWIILLRRGNGQPPAAAADLIWGMEREVREECEWWHGLGVSKFMELHYCRWGLVPLFLQDVVKVTCMSKLMIMSHGLGG
jgi:hypothetical protein